MESISHAGTAIGILATDGIVLAAEKKVTSKLLEQDISAEKMYTINANMIAAVAGIDSDASILVNYSRMFAQNYETEYSETVPCEALVKQLCDIKQSYTQHGGLRPFGVSFIYAGYDPVKGFQLYTSNPSGNFSGWKATSVGANNASAQTLLKQEYKDDVNLEMVCDLAVKVLAKTMDSTTLTSEKVEFATLGFKKDNQSKIQHKIWTPKDIDLLLKKTGYAKDDDEEEEE